MTHFFHLSLFDIIFQSIVLFRYNRKKKLINPMVTLFENPHETPLAMFLVQVFITLIVCKILAKLLSFIRQPQVTGQIIAGIIFGPSILGK
jgi:hypothetical protein